MKDFYYQIKTKVAHPGAFSHYGSPLNWRFPPLFSGKVTAMDKKEAKAIIDEEYSRKFPLRVLKDELESNEFLLSIQEIKEGSHLEKLFLKQSCSYCSSTFYVIDKYNDHYCLDKGFFFCSDLCKKNKQEEFALKILTHPDLNK